MFTHSGKERTTSKPLQHAPQAMQFQDSTYLQGTGLTVYHQLEVVIYFLLILFYKRVLYFGRRRLMS